MKTFNELLNRIIFLGKQAATQDYTKPEDAHKLRGSLAGFEACRNKSPSEIAALLAEADRDVTSSLDSPSEVYWEKVCRLAEIEWTANVLSAALANEGLPTIVNPTARGVLQAAKILAEPLSATWEMEQEPHPPTPVSKRED